MGKSIKNKKLTIFLIGVFKKWHFSNGNQAQSYFSNNFCLDQPNSSVSVSLESSEHELRGYIKIYQVSGSPHQDDGI